MISHTTRLAKVVILFTYPLQEMILTYSTQYQAKTQLNRSDLYTRNQVRRKDYSNKIKMTNKRKYDRVHKKKLICMI